MITTPEGLLTAQDSDFRIGKTPDELRVEFFKAIFGREDWISLFFVEKFGDRQEIKYDDNRVISFAQADGASGGQGDKLLELMLRDWIEKTKQTRANPFFGVYARPGLQHERAFQIRVVRVLFADLDNVTVPEALARVVAAKLPRASIVVNSGNGVHLYWILEEPYIIDDAGPPPPVHREFVDRGPDSKRLCRQYILDPQSDERLYLDVKSNVPPLSRKALFIQDILAGLGTVLGGDHVFDLSRRLRIPESWNRKDERNGAEPKPCFIVEFNPDMRYPLCSHT